MYNSEFLAQNVVIDCFNNNYSNTHSDNNPIDNNNNNNETAENRFGTGKRYDSGLGILSPQSEESLTNIFPKKYDDNVDNCYSTINIPSTPKTEINIEKKWNSLLTKSKDSSTTADLTKDDIIELKTVDSNNNMATSIVIYRNDNREFRHINIIDYRPKYKSKVRRSNTFSNDKNRNKHSGTQKYMCRSTDNLTFAQTSLSTDDLCNNISQGSSFSETTTRTPNPLESHNKLKSKSCCKIIQDLISNICCRKPLSGSIISEEEIPTFESYPDWKFSLDEFDDITYFSSGAQGTIYTATFKNMKVALKNIKENIKKDDINIEHLLALNHTNIITFIGICEEAPNYLVMEFCSQGQLFHWLHREIQISPKDIRSWALQICDGMAYLHKSDIIHRDLKSPNVLINDEHVLKIIDFEFSKDCCETKILNSFVGTMAWMAPEVLREEVHTKKIDIWSFGVVIWEMITREIPYLGIERLSILFGVGSNSLSLPICTSIPIEIKELLCKCWDQCPMKRPSFDEIKKDFSHYFERLEQYSVEVFSSMQLDWKKEIENQFKEMNKEKISTSKVEAELIRRRTKELSDAKNIKLLYNEKLKRADKLIALLNKCLNAVEDERKKNDSEWKLIQKVKQSNLLNSSNKTDPGAFLSLQVQNGVKNLKLPYDRSSKVPSPNHVIKKERNTYRHSMLEQTKTTEKSNKVRRKHSVPFCRDRSYFPGTKTKVDFELNIKEKKLNKNRPPRTSLSLETVANDAQRTSSLNVENCNKKSESRWKRNSSPCRNMGFSTLPSPNKTCLQVDDVSGIINPSFQESCESFTNLRELNKINSNLLQIAYFGVSASISDLNNSSENLSDSLNMGSGPPLFHRSMLVESITECPYKEEVNNMEEINEEIHEDDLNGLVIIRGTSGRSKSFNTQHSFSLKDSLDVSMITAESQTPYSLIEKENIAQGLIKPFGFLAHVNEDAISNSFRKVSGEHINGHSTESFNDTRTLAES